MKIDNRHRNRLWKQSTTLEGKQQTEEVIQPTEGTKRYYETVLCISDMLVRIRISGFVQIMTDQDPGGPKTCGSGSTILPWKLDSIQRRRLWKENSKEFVSKWRELNSRR
jgi:hypothetical protein